MNERGNITLALTLILIVVGFIVVLGGTILTVDGVEKRANETTQEIYKEDTALQTALYGVTNELANLQITSFNTTTPLLTPSILTTIQTKINNRLLEIQSDYSIEVKYLNPILIDSICDNLYTYNAQGVATHTGMYCTYTPIDVHLEITVLDDKGSPTGVATIKAKRLYLYENSKKLFIDDSAAETKLH